MDQGREAGIALIGRGIGIGTVFGIPIRVDYSWVVIAILLTVGVSFGLGQSYPYLGLLSRLMLGASACVLLFGSVLAHELSHSVVALRHGVGIRSITLFIFGGAAEMLEEPSNAPAEMKIAIAGPLMSLALSAVSGGAYLLAAGVVPPPLNEVVKELSLWNVMLAAFNVVPGFPLDGGRVLRAALWGIWGQFRTATRVASAVGAFFGAVVMFFGLMWLFVFRNPVGAIWFILIGLFLRYAARASYQQMLLRDALQGVTARDLMTSDVACVPPGMSLAAVVDEVFLPKGVTEVPVVDRGLLVGMLPFQALRGRDSGTLQSVTVGEVMTRDVLEEAVSPEEDAFRILGRFGSDGRRVLVVSDGVLLGIVTREDIFRRLELILELRR